jgi:putative phage-type endonuclease
MITEAQRQARSEFIGASDAAAAIGINPYQTPYQLYLDKTGQSEPFNGNELTYWGSVLEPPIANRLSEETGLKLRKHGQTIIAKEHPFMGCHLDYKVSGAPIVVEIKTGGFFTRNSWGESGSDQIPDQYLIQVQHQMICTGYRQALLGVLLGGQEFRHYSIPFDESLAEIIIQKERGFWECVATMNPPPPSTLGDVAQLYPRDTGQSIEAPLSVAGLVESLRSAKANANDAATKAETIEIELKNFIGSNSSLIDSTGKTLVTWKAQTTNRIDTTLLKKEQPDIAAQYTKATESRIWRLK